MARKKRKTKKKKTTKKQPAPLVKLSNTRGVQTAVYVNTAQPVKRKKRTKAPLSNLNYIPGQKRYLLNPNNQFNAVSDPYVRGHYQSIINAKINQDIAYVQKKLEDINKPDTFVRQRQGGNEGDRLLTDEESDNREYFSPSPSPTPRQRFGEEGGTEVQPRRRRRSQSSARSGASLDEREPEPQPAQEWFSGN
jgi:hypothetical protein